MFRIYTKLVALRVYLLRAISLIFCCALNALPLFEEYQELNDTIPYIQLANLPTPINRCHHLEEALGYHTIFIKRDDLTGSGDLYGGNKVRKLEFLLADAVQSGAKKIITFGCVGTNHGLATACYSQQLGLDCLLMLKNQPNSQVVRQNLLLDHYFGADIKIYSNNSVRKAALDGMLENNNDTYFIPTGGSNACGVLGYVNAAFELKEQIKEGSMPEPDVIYLPAGSCGTTAGLLLGFRLANISSKIIAVAVEPEEQLNVFAENIKRLYFEANQLLNSCSSAIPLLPFPDAQLIINKDFCGTEYGLWLRPGDDAARLMKNEEGIVVEGTYSAKSVAALIADIKDGIRKENEVILIWNTYCGLDFSHLTSNIDYKKLNSEVHRYFEDERLHS